jgi:hypothetical protein
MTPFLPTHFLLDERRLERSHREAPTAIDLKRSTIGAFALGALESDWADYLTFHINTAGCEICAANLEDLKSEGKAAPPQARERLFASSIGFLKKAAR